MSLVRRPLRMLGVTAAGLALAAPAAPAATTTPRMLPVVKERLAAASAKQQTCSARPRTGRGVDFTGYRAPDEGLLRVRLSGSDDSDWDLALFDAATGRKLDGSSAFRSNEIAGARLASGQMVRVQACRRSGAQRSVPVALEFTAMKLAAPKHKTQLVEVDVPTAWDRARLAQLGLDLTDHSDGRTQDALLYSPADAMKLTGAGFRYRVEIPDVAAQDRLDRASERRFARSGLRAGVPSGRTSYRTYDDYLNDLKQMVFDNPGVVRAVTLPLKTIEGRDIVGVEIARDVNRTDDGRPVFVQVGVHHAREWPAGEATIEFGLDLLSRGLAGEPRWKGVLDNARTFIIPIQNPDGFVASRSVDYTPLDDDANLGGPLSGDGGLGYRRKNCRPGPGEDGTPCEMRQDADNGVDTNRNYGEQWGGPGTSSNQSSLVYHGTGPFSEPETEAVRRFLLRLQPTLLITNHTYTGLMLRPPGTGDQGPAPDEDRMRAIGDAMARETEYISQYSYQLYDTTGTTDDWLYGGLGSFSFTPEIGKTNFHPSYTDDFVPEYDGKEGADKNGEPIKLGGLRAAYLHAAEAAIDVSSHSVLRGTAPGGRTLRIKRDFVTVTSARPNDNKVQNPVQRLQEHRETTLTVPANGRFEWHVAPSTRPFEREPVAWTLTCEDSQGRVLEQRDVFVERGQTLGLDLGCGQVGGPAGTQPPVASPSPAPLETCTDRLSPRSSFTRRASIFSRRRIALRGRSADRGCLDPGTNFLRAAGLERVELSIARFVRGRCQYLQSNGRLSSRRSCRDVTYLPAAGTATWRYERPVRLPRGHYKLWVRAADTARNQERKDARRNFLRVFLR